LRARTLRTRHFAVNVRASAHRRRKIETIAGMARGDVGTPFPRLRTYRCAALNRRFGPAGDVRRARACAQIRGKLSFPYGAPRRKSRDAANKASAQTSAQIAVDKTISGMKCTKVANFDVPFSFSRLQATRYAFQI
jgi:hypothetical protein